MKWDLPKTVNIDGEEYVIRNKCDYRVVLDVICALSDDELDNEHKAKCALFIFYENLKNCTNIKCAYDEMINIISCHQSSKSNNTKLMDWEQDFQYIAPAVSKILGYSVRAEENYTHWYDFIGAYMEIGECVFANIVTIRKKLKTGKKLEDWEKSFYQEHSQEIHFKTHLSHSDSEWLNDTD